MNSGLLVLPHQNQCFQRSIPVQRPSSCGAAAAAFADVVVVGAFSRDGVCFLWSTRAFQRCFRCLWVAELLGRLGGRAAAAGGCPRLDADVPQPPSEQIFNYLPGRSSTAAPAALLQPSGTPRRCFCSTLVLEVLPGRYGTAAPAGGGEQGGWTRTEMLPSPSRCLRLFIQLVCSLEHLHPPSVVSLSAGSVNDVVESSSLLPGCS